MPFKSLRQLADADFPTRWGHFRILGFEGVVAIPGPCNAIGPPPPSRVESAIALVMGDITTPPPPIVRIHSQCLTGDVFHSLRCDCRQQLELALAAIAAAGRGILIYENKEGRGIGLMAKLQAYQLQARASTPSRPTSSSASRPIAASTSSPPPFLPCSASPPSASSPTTPKKSPPSSPSASRSPSASPPRSPPTRLRPLPANQAPEDGPPRQLGHVHLLMIFLALATAASRSFSY